MHRTLADYIVDLTQNSVEAKSSVVIVDLIERDGRVKVYIADNGKGMSAETLSRVKDPFFTDGVKHEKRKVGLGISFLAQFMAQVGGQWDISSEKGVGTSLFFEYDPKNPDAPPIGNLPSAVVSCMSLPGGFDMKFTHEVGGNSYELMRSEIIETVGDLSDSEALITLREFVKMSESELVNSNNNNDKENL